MKKIILLFAVCMAFVAGLKAQSIVVGPKGGLNITNISNIDDSKNKLSFHLGAFAEIKMNDYFSIQPELLYSRQGLCAEKLEGWKRRARVNYLNIPVLAKFYVWDELSVDLGPQFGFALNGKYKFSKDGDSEKRKIRDLNTFDLSFALGLSYNWEDFMFSARYNFGITNVIDKDAVGDNNKNHVFQLSVGYRFDNLF